MTMTDLKEITPQKEFVNYIQQDLHANSESYCCSQTQIVNCIEQDLHASTGESYCSQSRCGGIIPQNEDLKDQFRENWYGRNMHYKNRRTKTRTNKHKEKKKKGKPAKKFSAHYGEETPPSTIYTNGIDNDHVSVATEYSDHSYIPPSGRRSTTTKSESSTSAFSMFESFDSLINALKRMTGIDDMDKVISVVESFTCMMVSCYDSKSTMGIIAAVLQFIKVHIDKSLFGTVKEYVMDLFRDSQGPGKKVVDQIKMVAENWRQFKATKNFSRFAQLLGLLVSVGFCKITSLEFTIGGFKVFNTRLIPIYDNCYDVFDASLATLEFLIDGAYTAFTEKSLRFLLVDDQKALSMDEEYTFITMAWPQIQQGNAREHLKLDNQEFDRRLEKLIAALKDVAQTLKGFDKKLVQDKLHKLLNIKNDFVTMQISSGIRISPFTLEFFGESSQGKTTICDQIVTAMLMSQDQPTDKMRQASINASDKFMSTWRSDILVAKLDDMCNTKSNFVEKAPTQWVIDICNNEPFYAPKAELESKGKVFVQPTICTISTNVKDLDAYTYSKCPYSIQRRAHLVISVRAKQQFQRFHEGVACGIDTTKVHEYTVKNPDRAFDDIWDLTVERAVKPDLMTATAKYSVFSHNGKRYKDVCFRDVMELCIDLYGEHMKQQHSIVNSMFTRKTDVNICGERREDGTKCTYIKGMCSLHSQFEPLPVEETPDEEESDSDEDDDDLEDWTMDYMTPAERTKYKRQKAKKKERAMRKQSGEEDDKIGSYTKKFAKSLVPVVQKETNKAVVKAEKATTDWVYKLAKDYLCSWNWLAIIPGAVLRLQPMKFLLNQIADKKSTMRAKQIHYVSAGLLALSGGLLAYDRKYTKPVMGVTLGLGITNVFVASQLKHIYRNMLYNQNDIISPMVKQIKDDYGNKMKKVLGAVGALVALRVLYRHFYETRRSQGNILNPTQESIEARDKEINPWIQMYKRPLHVDTHDARSTSAGKMKNILSKSLMYATVHMNGKKYSVNCLFIRTNYFILPLHYLRNIEGFKSIKDFPAINVTFRRRNPDSSAGTFQDRIEPTNIYHIPDTDLCVVYCATGGSFKDLKEYFPINPPVDHSFDAAHRTIDGEMQEAYGYAKVARVGHDSCTFDGFHFDNLSIKTFYGLCGTVYYSNSVGSMITGIHLGGITDTPKGCAGFFFQSFYDQAIDYFKSKNFVCNAGCEGTFREVVLGRVILTDEPLSKKSPMNYLPHGSTIQYHGSCLGKATTKTEVVQTKISPIVERCLGVPNKWRPPKMSPEWWAWQQCLANLAVPSKSLPYDLVERAVDDYIHPMIDKVNGTFWSKKLRPLNDLDNLHGQKGVKFIDAIKKNTAIGAPLTGKKSQFMTQVEGTEEYPHKFELDQELINEIEYCHNEYKHGRRVYSLIKAAKKDEVHTKEKCRIFYVNNLTLTWLIRKYFLPIVKLIQEYPTVSECAVGVNAQSREWEQLHSFMTKQPNLFGGDYSKYDQKIPSQLILAAFRILITLASYCDYTEEDLAVMHTIAADVVYAVVMFNGDLVSFTSGTHISGNSLTVIINGLVGALNLRCAFFHLNPEVGSYRDHCSIMTYGDDNAGSFSKHVNFGIKSVSKYLSEYGQKYTMPDKDSELVETLTPDKFDFLKRKTTYVPEIDCHVGSLDPDSMIKQLHMHIPSDNADLLPEDQYAESIESFMRDAFYHGREFFNEWQPKLIQLAEETNLHKKCPRVYESFDYHVHKWKMTYDPEYAALHQHEEEKPPKFSTFDLE